MKWLFLTSYLLTVVTGLALSWLNMTYQKRWSRQMAEFLEKLDPNLLQQTMAYSSAKTRIGMAKTFLHATLLTIFVFGPWLALVDAWISGISESFVITGLIFFLGLALVNLALDIPFDFYRTFVLETRFGFNNMTIGLWWTDRIKSVLLSLTFIGLLVSGSLWLVQSSPRQWWLWVWLFTIALIFFFQVLSPRIIEPLFYRFEPIDSPHLEYQIQNLSRQAGIRDRRIFKVDASRRTRHANAYFSGFGRQKRIVLFDTLLQQLDTGEILAVLAHEIGHWRHHHLSKKLFGTAVLTLGGFYLAFFLLNWGGLPRLIGQEHTSFPAQTLILSLMATIASFLFTPLRNWLSRRHEWQADHFAAELTGEPRLLAEALLKLARNNLANLCPHPLYAWYYYSHPPLVQRIRELMPCSAQEKNQVP
jgi:STE24 endopeptidase